MIDEACRVFEQGILRDFGEDCSLWTQKPHRGSTFEPHFVFRRRKVYYTYIHVCSLLEGLASVILLVRVTFDDRLFHTYASAINHVAPDGYRVLGCVAVIDYIIRTYPLPGRYIQTRSCRVQKISIYPSKADVGI